MLELHYVFVNVSTGVSVDQKGTTKPLHSEGLSE